MKNIYYLIWVDAMIWARSKNNAKMPWKFYTMMTILYAQGCNLATILLLFATLGVKSSFFCIINFFPGQRLDGMLAGFITLGLPFLILNYFLIFHKKRYFELIKKYGNSYKNGKLYISYVLISPLLFIIPVIIGMLFFDM